MGILVVSTIAHIAFRRAYIGMYIGIVQGSGIIPQEWRITWQMEAGALHGFMRILALNIVVLDSLFKCGVNLRGYIHV